RQENRRAARDRELAFDELQLHADEHQDPRVAKSFARGPSCGRGRRDRARAEKTQDQGERMSITLYYGSGSPYAWRAQLALEHKALPYELKLLSFAAGDTRKPEFLALNPRHRVPVLVDGDFVLYESNAIVEYVDDAYPGRGAPLFPGDAKTRAVVRRLVFEVDNYLDKAA